MPPVVVRAALARGTFQLEVVTDGTAEAAYVSIDQAGRSLGGVSPETGTPEGLFDGFVPASLRTDTDRIYELELDAADLEPGLHVVTVRVPRAAAGSSPPFFTEATAYIEVGGAAPPADGGVALDAEPADATSGPDASGSADVGGDAGAEACAFAGDPSQGDFDGDGVVDPCDDCPETPSGLAVGEDGCALLSPAAQAELDRIVDAILAQRFEAALDQNADGVIDVSDFVLRANRGDRP